MLYQVFPKSFSDSNGDGIGDLLSTLNHLNHFTDLGSDGIRSSPVHTSPIVDFGYDNTDHCDWLAERPGAGFTTGKPWLPFDDRSVMPVAAQSKDDTSMLLLYRALLQLRRRESALQIGS